MASTSVSTSARRGVNHACTFTYTSSRVMSAMSQIQAAEYVASYRVGPSTNVTSAAASRSESCQQENWAGLRWLGSSTWDRCGSPREVVGPKIDCDGGQAQNYADPENRRMMDRSSFARSWLHFDHLVGRFLDKLCNVACHRPLRQAPSLLSRIRQAGGHPHLAARLRVGALA
jgi:hypothetical protein